MTIMATKKRTSNTRRKTTTRKTSSKKSTSTKKATTSPNKKLTTEDLVGTNGNLTNSLLGIPSAEDLDKKIEEDLKYVKFNIGSDGSFQHKNVKNLVKYHGPFQDLEDRGVTRSEYEYKNYFDVPTRESLVDGENRALLDIPAWGYKDYINERIEWQKGLNSMLNDPAWFYFKIFFKFDTDYGLFGGVMNDVNTQEMNKLGNGATSSAVKYLLQNEMTGYHQCLRLKDKRHMLLKFIFTLSYISSKAPWFFSAVHDVNNALVPDTTNFTKEKSIVIDCLEESIDMKLITLMDLYKHAVYDDNYQVEVLPENLRKFDMDIVVFQTPLRYFHTSAIDLTNRTTKYKSFNGSDFSERMSFKLFTFKNCEFDFASLNSMLPSNFTNDKPFNSKPTIKVNYSRCYQHTSNEFAGLLFGSDGIYEISKINNDYTAEVTVGKENTEKKKENKKSNEPAIVMAYDNSSTDKDKTRREMLKYMNDHPNYSNMNSSIYKSLVDASEMKISGAMRMIDGSVAFGNLYGSSDNWGNTIAKTFKDTVKNTARTYKNIGKSFIDRWT